MLKKKKKTPVETHSQKPRLCQKFNSLYKLLALCVCLPYGPRCVCSARHIRRVQRRTSEKHLILFITGASISYRSKIDTLRETQTQNYGRHFISPPLLFQKERERERESEPSQKHRAGWVTWQSGEKVIAVGFIFNISNTCTHVQSTCLHTSMCLNASSVSLAEPWWRTPE